MAQTCLAQDVLKKGNELADHIQRMLCTAYNERIHQEVDAQRNTRMNASRQIFLHDVADLFINNSQRCASNRNRVSTNVPIISPYSILTVANVTKEKSWHGHNGTATQGLTCATYTYSVW